MKIRRNNDSYLWNTKLKIGQVLFRKTGNYGYVRTTVSRIEDNRAILDNGEIVNNLIYLDFHADKVVDIIDSPYKYTLSNKKLEEAYNSHKLNNVIDYVAIKKELKILLENINIHRLSKDEIIGLINILK